MCPSGRGQVLIPWPNRLEDGSYEFDGRRHQLADRRPGGERRDPRPRPLGGVDRRPDVAPDRVVMEHRAPSAARATRSRSRSSIEYALSDAGLSVTTTATNVGTEPCPYGCGAHPYLTLGTRAVDSLVLRAPGGTVLSSDERGLPSGRSPVEGTEYDFRRPRPIGSTRLDNCFTDLERGDGRSRPRRARRPGERERARALGRQTATATCMLFTGDPAAGREPAQPGGRADDVPAERVPERRGAGPPGARRLVHELLGDLAPQRALSRRWSHPTSARSSSSSPRRPSRRSSRACIAG